MNTELKEKERIAMERLKAFEPEDGYFLAYSGGKDSGSPQSDHRGCSGNGAVYKISAGCAY